MFNLPSQSVLQSAIADFSCPDGDSIALGFTFLQTSAQLMKDYEAFFGRYGLSGGRFAILLVLQQNVTSQLTPTECAQAAGVRCGTVSGLLNGLERQGLIFRSGYPNDGRMFTIQLSEQGQQLMEKLVPEYLRWIATLSAQLDGTEIALLETAMGASHYCKHTHSPHPPAPSPKI